MSDIQQRQQTRPVHMQPKSDAELEAEAVEWCERMGAKLNAKKSDHKPRPGWKKWSGEG